MFRTFLRPSLRIYLVTAEKVAKRKHLLINGMDPRTEPCGTPAHKIHPIEMSPAWSVQSRWHVPVSVVSRWRSDQTTRGVFFLNRPLCQRLIQSFFIHMKQNVCSRSWLVQACGGFYLNSSDADTNMRVSEFLLCRVVMVGVSCHRC